jgi:hypothetical protein
MTEQDVIFEDDDDGLSAGSDQAKPEEKNDDFELEARYRDSPITLTVFKRESDGYVNRNFNLQRTYPKDEEGNDFGHTNSLRGRDLLKAAGLLRRAYRDLNQGVETDI